MLYWFIPQLNPLLPTLVLCPLLAVAVGMLFARLQQKRHWAFMISFLLPLTFTAKNAVLPLGVRHFAADANQ